WFSALRRVVTPGGGLAASSSELTVRVMVEGTVRSSRPSRTRARAVGRRAGRRAGPGAGLGRGLDAETSRRRSGSRDAMGRYPSASVWRLRPVGSAPRRCAKGRAPACEIELPIATEKKPTNLARSPGSAAFPLLETRLRRADSRNRIRERLSRTKNPGNHAVSSEGLLAYRLPSFARASLNNCHPKDR